MSALPLKGILTILLVGGAGISVSGIPQLFKKTKVPRLILARNNGKELYIRLEDLKNSSSNLSKLKDCIKETNRYCDYQVGCIDEGQEEDCEEELENSTSVALWIDDKKLDWTKHSLESPFKDGKFYLLEKNKGGKSFLGDRELLRGDERSDTLQRLAKDNPNYFEFSSSDWIGSTNGSLEKIVDCAYLKEGEGYDDITIICAPHTISNGWNVTRTQTIFRQFENTEITNY